MKDYVLLHLERKNYVTIIIKLHKATRLPFVALYKSLTMIYFQDNNKICRVLNFCKIKHYACAVEPVPRKPVEASETYIYGNTNFICYCNYYGKSDQGK